MAQSALFSEPLQEYGRVLVQSRGRETLSMMKRVAILIAATALAAPAHAQDVKVDPDHIITVLQDTGYPAEYFEGSDTKDYRQILSKTGNYQFLVEMYDCVDGKACETLEFYSNFPVERLPT